MLGGHTATMHEGRVTQFGPTAETYRAPDDLTTARGLLRPADQRRPGREARAARSCSSTTSAGPRPAPPRRSPTAAYTLGLRPHFVSPGPHRRRRDPAHRHRPHHRALGLRESSPTSRPATASGSPSPTACIPTASASRTASGSTSPTASTSPPTGGGSPDGRDPPRGAAPRLHRAPDAPRGLRAEGDRPRLEGRRRLRAARPLRLRQDHAPQHHLRPRRPVRGPRPLRRPRRHPPGADRAQHRPGVPVPGHLRHDDRLRQPRLPAAQPRRPRRPPSTPASAPSPTCSSSTPMLGRRASGPDRRRQAEDLDGPRPRPRGRQRHHVRRAADRHRPAPEVAAALQAQGAAPAGRRHDDLRHPRPDRGADLRRPGRRHAGRQRRAGRLARSISSSARPTPSSATSSARPA